MPEDKNVSRKTLADSFVQRGGIATLSIRDKRRKGKELKKVLDENTSIIKKDGITLVRLEKTFNEIDKNIRRMKFFVSKNLELEMEDLRQIPQETTRQRKKRTEALVSKPPERRKPSFFLRFLRVPKRKPKPRPKTKLRKRNRVPPRRTRASVRKRQLNQRLRRFLVGLRARAAARIKKLRGLNNYQSTVRAQRTQAKLERARIRQEIARERARIDTEARARINAADAEARTRLNAADAEGRRLTTAAEAEAKARLGAADIEAQKRVTEANRLVNEANEKIRLSNENLKRIEQQRLQAINDAADAKITADDARRELKTIREQTNLATEERQKRIQAQEARIREMEAINQTMRDEAARLEVRKNQVQTELTDAETKLKTAQATINEPRPTPAAVEPTRVAPTAQIEPTRPPVAAVEPLRPAPAQPKPYVPLNPQTKAVISGIARNKLVEKASSAVAKKLPLIGLVIAGGIITWELIQGKITKAAISVAETFDPTIIGITLATALPQIKLETYQETFGIDPNIDPENPGGILAGPRYKEVSDLVDAEWEKVKKEISDKWKQSKQSIIGSWKRDLERGVGQTLRESITPNAPVQRGRGRNVIPAPGQGSIPVDKPPPGSLLLPNQTVFDAIKKASELTGVDAAILLAMAKQESGFNPTAKANSTSAKGLFQFLDSTWNDMIKKYGKEYPQLLAGPYDSLASAIAGALYVKENSTILQRAGIQVNGTSLYALHFLGPGGGPKLLRSDENALAASILPEAAKANPNVFYVNGDLRFPKTVKQVLEFLYSKVGSQAEQYAAMINQNKSGSQIADTSTQVAAAEQQTQRGSQPVIVVNNNNNTIVGAGRQQAPRSSPEVHQRVG